MMGAAFAERDLDRLDASNERSFDDLSQIRVYFSWKCNRATRLCVSSMTPPFESEQAVRRLTFVLITLSLLSAGSAARPVAEQPLSKRIVEYRIDARLELDSKRQPSIVKGRELLTWKNDSPDTVSDLQFHLYLNAFKNQKSTFYRESGGQLRGDSAGRANWGWIDVASMKIAGGEDLTAKFEFIHPDDDNADDQTVLHVALSHPIAPGASITLDISFTSQLPRVFARTGYLDRFALVGQWFPKIGVWESVGDRGATRAGWNCHQFHADSEFYADFGTYDVRLTVPASEIVGATGKQQGDPVSNPDQTKTYHFAQADVHDFAWTVSPEFVRVARAFKAAEQTSAAEIDHWASVLGLPRDQIELKDVEVILLLQPEHRAQVERHFRAAFNAIKYFGLWYGKYPYDTLTIVDPPYNGEGAGGMEYPTFITAGTSWWPGRDQNPEEVIVHEFGHQYWYGMAANNEFEESWLDEGFVTYSTNKVLQTAYGDNVFPMAFFGVPMFYAPVQFPRPLGDRILTLRGPFADPILTPAWKFSDRESYAINSYPRSGITLATLEGYLGEDTMARVMREYFHRYKFHHPTTQNFIDTVNRITGQDNDWFFDQFVKRTGTLDYRIDAVTSESVKAKLGLYDKDGKRVEVKEDQAPAEPGYVTEISVRRDGEAYFPVELRAVFEDGSVINDQWDGRDRWHRFKYTTRSRLRYATIDPDNKILLDANIVNNSYTMQSRSGAAWRWASAVHYWTDVLLQFFASLG